MAEQKIILVIDEEGAVSAKTFGFEGETCLEALDEILDETPVTSIKTTDEYLKKVKVNKTNTIKQGRDK
ncbi:DUF2997 domain-containing protein [Endozoicomonas euniceicola]|uniref:DUF2997 domain-containing protein n=1 Tax=Endozoicomonas euniceicola TaxID=1234143 RepID=A0ABY6GT19_9GAMM|nr:DUF2997 domain-containing protein [Endozoicomonas euniceicola]UYM15899.1 DUF2997 domain-containing protein [Endozoicomonas euniceicola]